MSFSTSPCCQRAQPGTAKTSWNRISTLTNSVSPLLDDRKHPTFPPQGQMKGEDWGEKCTYASWLLWIYFSKDMFWQLSSPCRLRSCMSIMKGCVVLLLFFSQTFWVIRKVYLVLTCIVCGKPQNHENIFVTINCRPCWKSSVCDMTALREWSENVPNARDLLK